MTFFELDPADISSLNDGDLRELVARLCEAELIQQGIPPACVTWGGAQEAPDGGLDVSIKDALGISSLGFVIRERTGFQVKKHTVGKASCQKEMQEKGEPKPVIAELAKHHGAYIIVSGKDNCTDKMLAERMEGMRSAVSTLTDKDQLHLDFFGCDRLSAWLRRHPSVSLWVRSRLGKPLAGWRPYERWAATPPDQNDDFLIDGHPCVTDTNSRAKESQSVSEGIQLTRNRLRPPGSTVRITGLSGVGKTRFAQALFESEVGKDALPHSDVIYADLGTDLSPPASELITYLIANDFANYLVLDNCPPDVHRNLQKQALAGHAKLRLLTIEYDISDDKPEETDVIHLEPSSEATVSKLLLKRFPQLGSTNADRIAEFAGGNARVALALASRVEADETLTNFSDEALFERLFSQRKGHSSELMQRAEILALVYSFNVTRAKYGDELTVLGSIAGVSRQALHNGQAELLRRQLAQQRGDWRAVLPHAMANRLAKRALQNISPEDINAELFKPENQRLLSSCAHRLGYLHDFSPARELALSWLSPGAPLSNITRCNDQQLAVLNYVAPVFPDVVLRSIEEAAADPEFASRKNPNFSRFVRLLCHFAYEAETFDRSTAVLLQFAETEKAGERNNSILTQLQQLFSLHLSGTEATPEKRQSFVRKLLASSNSRHREIAGELLQTAFKMHGWVGFGPFHFGARIRGRGWTPKTREEETAWYSGFIQLLQPTLASAQTSDRDWAKSVLARHFRGLWTVSRCFDLLEQIVRDYGNGGQWPEIWLSIKQTLHYDSTRLSPKLLDRLQSLEKLTAPQDLLAEIRSYALLQPWEHVDLRAGDFQENMEKMRQRVCALGEMAAANADILDDLGAAIWTSNSNAVQWFGEGLAKVAEKRETVFDRLANSFAVHATENSNPYVLAGFIGCIHSTAPAVAQKMIMLALQIPGLKRHAVLLLAAAPITPWASACLLKLAQSGELAATSFQYLSFGRIHEAIPDSEFASLLSAILALDDGYLTIIEILHMRFHGMEARKYCPNPDLQAVARASIRALLSEHRSSIRHVLEYRLDDILAIGFGPSAPLAEVQQIIEMVCEGIETYRLYAFEIGHVTSALLRMHPEIFLDAVFTHGKERRDVAYLLFKERLSSDSASLNDAPLDRFMAWCGDDQECIQELAAAVTSFIACGPVTPLEDHPACMTLSPHIKALFTAAKDKCAMVEIIYGHVMPSSYSGSRANIMQIRSKAFEELLNYSDAAVQVQVQDKLSILEKAILAEQQREAAEQHLREQRFE